MDSLEIFVKDLISLWQTLAGWCHRVINAAASLGAIVLPFLWYQHPMFNPEQPTALLAMSNLYVSALRSVSVDVIRTIIPSLGKLTQNTVKQGKVWV